MNMSQEKADRSQYVSNSIACVEDMLGDVSIKLDYAVSLLEDIKKYEQSGSQAAAVSNFSLASLREDVVALEKTLGRS